MAASGTGKTDFTVPMLEPGDWRWVLPGNAGPLMAHQFVQLRTQSNRRLVAIELGIVLGWTLWFTWPYFNFDALVIPTGLEYPSAIHPFHVWTRLLECGACAWWNGSVHGGYPAMAELQAGLLHPLPMLGTLVFGVSNGLKLTLIGAFYMAGLGQWWLGQVCGAGRVARTWAACMAVVAGNLAGRMEGGWPNLVLAAAAYALVLPPLIRSAETRSRRWAAVLGICLALLLVAGQGYLQAGTMLLLPLALVLAEPNRVWATIRRLALALVLAFMLAAPFLAPFLHFMPQFGKDIDPAFHAAQPLRFVPLQLVIDDLGFLKSEALGQLAFPGLNTNFVGWIPVLLALIPGAVFLDPGATRRQRRRVLFLGFMVLFAICLAAAVPLRFLAAKLPATIAVQLAGLRHVPYLLGLAVPPLLGLSALGLDRLLGARAWPRLEVAFSHQRGRLSSPIDSRWLLAIPLALALRQAAQFNGQWIATTPIPPAVLADLDAIPRDEAQWVAGANHVHMERAVGMGLKLTNAFKPWFWLERSDPPAMYALAGPGGPAPGFTERTAARGGRYFEAPESQAYALVEYPPTGLSVCRAQSRGGNIDLDCASPAAGALRVNEHAWAGWRAWLDGEPVPIEHGDWITIAMPAGEHRVALRYRPWDLPWGFAIAGGAWLAILIVWRRS